MRADSIHGNIGSAMRKRPNIYTFDDFVDVCDGSTKKIKPVTLGVHDFYEFEDGHRARTSKTVTLPLLNKVKVVKFQSGSRSMWFKNNFNGQFEEVNFLKPKFKIDVGVPVKSRPRGISTAKRQNILNLLQAAPPAKRKFWMEATINDETNDLVDNFN